MLILDEHIGIRRGATYEHTFYVLDNDETLIGLTNYEAIMQIKKKTKDIRVVLDITEYLDLSTHGENGLMLLTIPYSVTNSLEFNSGVFDIKIRHTGSDKVDIVAEGLVTVSESVSRF